MYGLKATTTATLKVSFPVYFESSQYWDFIKENTIHIIEIVLTDNCKSIILINTKSVHSEDLNNIFFFCGHEGEREKTWKTKNETIVRDQ